MDTLDRIRQFNRFYTARLGLLGQRYAGGDMALSQVRVLHDLALHGPLTSRRCADTLGLDEGYVSRIVSRLEKAGYLRRTVDAADKRVRSLTITAAGRRKVDALVIRSREDIAERLENCTGAAIDAAARALGRAALLLGPADPDAVTLRDLGIGDVGWLIKEHGESYARDEGFDASFEILVADILCAFVRDHDPTRERAFIAEIDGHRLGSVFCVKTDRPGVAKLRLFYLVAEARGLGLGRRLLEACMGFARDAGYTRMELWTHKSHRAACRLYDRYGFEVLDRKPVRAFGTDQIEMTYGRDL